jgi:hypothetical protein
MNERAAGPINFFNLTLIRVSGSLTPETLEKPYLAGLLGLFRLYATHGIKVTILNRSRQIETTC